MMHKAIAFAVVFSCGLMLGIIAADDSFYTEIIEEYPLAGKKFDWAVILARALQADESQERASLENLEALLESDPDVRAHINEPWAASCTPLTLALLSALQTREFPSQGTQVMELLRKFGATPDEAAAAALQICEQVCQKIEQAGKARTAQNERMKEAIAGIRNVLYSTGDQELAMAEMTALEEADANKPASFLPPAASVLPPAPFRATTSPRISRVSRSLRDAEKAMANQ